MKKNALKWLTMATLLFLLNSCSLFTNDKTDDSPTNEDDIENVDDTNNENEETDDNPDDQAETDNLSQDLNDWMPRLNDVIYHYGGTESEFASFTWNPQFNEENIYQTATFNGGTKIVEIYDYREDEIVRVFTRPETYFRDNFMSIDSVESTTPEETILKTPIAVGTSWSGENSEYEITQVNVEMDILGETVEIIEVTQTFDDAVSKRYYAKDIGLVYKVDESDEFVVESILTSMEENATEEIPISVFAPDNNAMGLDVTAAEIMLPTNSPARIAIQELLLGNDENFSDVKILPDGTSINYLFLNNNNIVEVDLSSEYITNMNVGSSGESLFLHSLANTLIQYYGAEEVLLTIDGEPYSGGHIAFMEGETIPFNNEIVN